MTNFYLLILVIYLINTCYNYCKLCAITKIYKSVNWSTKYAIIKHLIFQTTLQNSRFDFFFFNPYLKILCQNPKHQSHFHFGKPFFKGQGKVSGQDWFVLWLFLPQGQISKSLDFTSIANGNALVLQQTPWNFQAKTTPFHSSCFMWQVFVFHFLSRSMQEFLLGNASKISPITMHWEL